MTVEEIIARRKRCDINPKKVAKQEELKRYLYPDVEKYLDKMIKDGRLHPSFRTQMRVIICRKYLKYNPHKNKAINKGDMISVKSQTSVPRYNPQSWSPYD